MTERRFFMAYKFSDNEALHTDALFFDAVNLKMRLFTDSQGNTGPRHVREFPGVRIEDNGDVKFCIYAPKAKEVAVAGFPGSAMTDARHYMTRDSEGYWHVTVSGIPAGYHYHEYFVDGNCVINPQAPVGYGAHKAVNFFDIPEERDFYALKDVPHGTLCVEHFYSSVTGRCRDCWVYTPPGYDEETGKTYPVLYLQHGGGETETGWVWQGKVNYIIDNLLAEKKCCEMIVVMNCLYCVNDKKDEEFLSGDFDSMLIKDCIPFIEKKFRVRDGNGNRAMAGLSMGSYQTTMTAMRHLGYFPYIGIFSGTLERRWYCDFDYYKNFEDPEAFNEKVKLFFFGYGEQEDRIVAGLKNDFERFGRTGIKYTVFTCPGYHEWTVWRKCMESFAGLLFK
jgi:enterochelin esterase-like enzyme